jgi:hypothetical protein
MNRHAHAGAPIENLHVVAPDGAEHDPDGRDLIRELKRCLDGSGTLTVDDKTDVARATQFRDAIESAFVAGDIVTEEVLGLTVDLANLRDELVPGHRTSLTRDAKTGPDSDDWGGS